MIEPEFVLKLDVNQWPTRPRSEAGTKKFLAGRDFPRRRGATSARSSDSDVAALPQ
jgi:hypothetical protein